MGKATLKTGKLITVPEFSTILIADDPLNLDKHIHANIEHWLGDCALEGAAARIMNERLPS